VALGPAQAALALADTEVKEVGRLDIVVANGVLRDKVRRKMTDGDFGMVIEVHLCGTFTCARTVALRLAAHR
jgi:NAD(P)-dependent dehydrogenase (short-subunit alcohol dehydrogenase family)